MHCSGGVLAAVLRRSAEIAKITDLKGLNFWSNSILVANQYLSARATVLSTFTAIHTKAIVLCTSSSQTFQFSMSGIHWLLLFGHPSSHLLDIAVNGPSRALTGTQKYLKQRPKAPCVGGFGLFLWDAIDQRPAIPAWR